MRKEVGHTKKVEGRFGVFHSRDLSILSRMISFQDFRRVVIHSARPPYRSLGRSKLLGDRSLTRYLDQIIWMSSRTHGAFLE